MEAAASVVAFVQAAGAIAKCIVKTKQLWDQLKDLPRELNDLIEDIEAFGECFQEIEAQFNNQQVPSTACDATVARRSFRQCQRALTILEDLVKDLSIQVESKKGLKKKLVLVKAHTKQELLNRYQSRLERCILHLNLSAQSYQTSLIRQIPELVVTRVTSDLLPQLSRPQLLERQTIQSTTCSQSQTNPPKDQRKALVRSKTSPVRAKTVSPSKWGRFAITYVNGSGAWQACVQWPSWVSKSVHELHSGPTLSGWTYNYRVYNVVSHESDIMIKVRSGDKQGVLELFSARKASPLDRDGEGHSLLYHAAKRKRYDLCQLFLSMGLQDMLHEVVGVGREGPLSALIYSMTNTQRDWDWDRFTELFQSYIHEPPSMLIHQIFDFLPEWSYGDEFVVMFRKRFIPKWYCGPLQYRLEAIRLGCFHVRSPLTLLQLLSKDSEVKNSDVDLSTHDKLSLVHSAAIALGIRFAEEMVPYSYAPFQRACYDDAWSYVVQKVMSAAGSNDLHAIEAVRPWDVYHVPIWTGTPLTSVLAGALCYLSPDVPRKHWDAVFQQTLRQWLEELRGAGVDLAEYGQKEALLFKDQVKGALDADAINSSRGQLRDMMAWSTASQKLKQAREDGWNESHWIPIRFLDIKVGASPDDWQIIWAPEFEYMAYQFWTLVEKGDIVMPGSWVE